MIATDALLDVFVDLADTLVDDYDLHDFLHRLTVHVAAVTRASTVGLVLADEGERLQFMAASTEDARSVELFQLQSNQGPCVDCFRTGEPVTVPDLAAAAERWPTFAPGALERGVRSVHAFPMRLRGHVLGALNVFGGDLQPLGAAEIKVIQSMADIATIAILQGRALHAAETLSSQLQTALSSRIVIEQAKGILAQVLDTDVDTAFERMRSSARRQHLHLDQVARDVVDQRIDLSTWRR